MQFWELADKPSLQARQPAGEPGKSNVAVMHPKRKNSFFSGGLSLSLKTLSWLAEPPPPHHIAEKYGYHSLNELTHKINHHTCAFRKFFEAKNTGSR